MARIDTEGMQWLRSNHPFFYARRASPCLCQDSLKERGAREGSFMGVRNDPVMVIDHGLSRPRLPICLGNTRKGSGEKGEGRTPLSMA